MSAPNHSSNSLQPTGVSGCLTPHLLIRKQWKHGHPFMSDRPLGSLSSVIVGLIMYLSFSSSCYCVICPSDIIVVRADVICFFSMPSFSANSLMSRPSFLADFNSLRIRSTTSFIEMTFDKTHGNIERSTWMNIK